MCSRKNKSVKSNKCGGKGFKRMVTSVFFIFFEKKIKIKLKLGGKNIWKKINRIGQEPYN